MAATAQKRGWKIYYDGDNWRYLDNNDIADYEIVCKNCGKAPTKEGYDACLGKLPGVEYACCGHGEESPTIIWDEEVTK